MTKERQLLNKQKELIKKFKFRYVSWSKNEADEITNLESGIAALEAELEQEAITDADIEAWAEKEANTILVKLGSASEILYIGAKAVLNGEIKHIK